MTKQAVVPRRRPLADRPKPGNDGSWVLTAVHVEGQHAVDRTGGDSEPFESGRHVFVEWGSGELVT
ncbi:MAG: hypothetical protein KJN63_02765, partial [Acidimicrobiia bacterium]|nr:hypothetical protein [Acidimicrobiia bacterium]